MLGYMRCLPSFICRTNRPLSRYFSLVLARFQKLALRDYQEQCIDDCLGALGTGKRRIAVSLATGGGKTVIFSHLISQVVPSKGYGHKTLVLVHRKELAVQAAKHCQLSIPDSKVEIDMGALKSTHTADITVASVWTLKNDRLALYNPRDYKMIIIDECHHASSKSYERILSHFQANLSNSPVAVVGFSATIERNDGMSLQGVFDEIVFRRDVMEMIDNNWLCDAKFTTVTNAAADMSQVKVGKSKDYLISSLAKHMNTDATNELILKTYMHLAVKNRLRSTLIFCVDVAHVQSLFHTFQSKGINAQYVTGKTKSQYRGEIVQDFKAGKIPVLLNCGVFTEGTDIPNIDSIFLARPTKSKPLLLQIIGRGLRLHEGKSFCHVVDFVGVNGNGLISVPTLAGLDPSASVTDMTMAEMVELAVMEREKTELAALALNKVKMETFEGFASFMLAANKNNSSDEELIRQSRNHWVRVNLDSWVRSIGKTGRYFRLQREDFKVDGAWKNRYYLTEVREIPRHAPTGAKFHYRMVLFDKPLDEILKHEMGASSFFGMQWRQRAPTPKQITSIEMRLKKIVSRLKFEGGYSPTQEEVNTAISDEMSTLTMGAASDLLTASIFTSSRLKWFLKRTFGDKLHFPPSTFLSLKAQLQEEKRRYLKAHPIAAETAPKSSISSTLSG
ncbi:hypothetical protein BABINDRAFT_160029 [Babjeviella inositovora NRRL Y-12698]|uniref:Helicase ATP-binding domain-containing protein n=1 Tax=Babjeviella inositovora NRRL Y-12698 TaxID=984486 RepID=A0A1E3QVU9_9ASCO|nr:uncharacterized protein BABINDRAFT_160029 [Babjeviella inositovora NRRL Y-12698]ODQ81789.1 hypothetical protein BABINDRAFT_160029 [Babjeviella inositovora NRRL Y-12698]